MGQSEASERRIECGGVLWDSAEPLGDPQANRWRLRRPGHDVLAHLVEHRQGLNQPEVLKFEEAL